MEWHAYHKDWLAKTAEDDPQEVAKASQDSEMLVAAASAELPRRARFEDGEMWPPGGRCDARDEDMWPDITEVLLTNLERVRRESSSYAPLRLDVGMNELLRGEDLHWGI